MFRINFIYLSFCVFLRRIIIILLFLWVKFKLLFMRKILIAFFVSFVMVSMAQETDIPLNEHEENLKGASRLTLGLGHTYITEENVKENNNWLGITSWSLNYDYWLSNKFALGLQNDILFESFLVENLEGEKIERKYPIAVVPVAMYKLNEKFTLLGGVGFEYTKDHTLTMSRLGVEYGLPLKKHTEVGVALVWDYNWNHYHSIGVSFTVSKLWSRNHR